MTEAKSKKARGFLKPQMMPTDVKKRTPGRLAFAVDKQTGLMRTFFAAAVALDVVRLLALAVALWHCALELVCVWEDDFLSGAGLDEAVVDGFGHGSWAGVFALDNVFARGLVEDPHYGLGWGGLQMVGQRVHAIAVEGQDDEVVLPFRFVGHWQAEDLVDILPSNAELDASICGQRAHAAVFLVNQLEGELFPLREGEAGAGVLPPWLCRCACQARWCCGAVVGGGALLELALLGGGFAWRLRCLAEDVCRNVAEESVLCGVLICDSSLVCVAERCDMRWGVGVGVGVDVSVPMAACTRLRRSWLPANARSISWACAGGIVAVTLHRRVRCGVDDGKSS